jgi:hypothetical protein
MRRILLVFSIVFTLLTLAGTVYVIISHGQKSAGFAIVPAVFAIAFISALKKQSSNKNS